jgi:hypothetical protein
LGGGILHPLGGGILHPLGGDISSEFFNKNYVFAPNGWKTALAAQACPQLA